MHSEADTPKVPKHDHCGHRKRMKNKRAEFGSEIFSDHELLEMLLFYSIPQRNTNDIAHELVSRFGTPRKAIEADEKQLATIKGVKENTTCLFDLIREIYRRDRVKLPYDVQRFDTLSSVGEYLTRYYAGLHEERFCALLLDGSMRLIKFCNLSSGSVNSAAVDVKALARLALAENAANVIIAHNHPSGNALPSNADRELTSRIEAALSAIGITLIEHIIVGEVGYTPTMQIRISSLRSPLSTSELDNGFLRKFYNE